jgi:putative transposase
MRKSRYTDEQMVKILREADRSPVADVAKKHGLSEQTIYVWRKRFGTMTANETKRMRALEQENGRVKKLVAERDLEIEVMEEIGKKMVSACARRQQVAYASTRGLSQRRACALLRTARSGLRYESRKAAKDAAALTRMAELARQYPRYGYRRIRVFLGRDGHKMSNDRAYRLWRSAKLQVLKKRPRRRVAAARPKAIVATGPNQIWAYDFVFDACANGQQLKCLTVIDEYTREALAIDVAGSIRSARMIEVLAKLISIHGAPRALKSDNGPKFV